MYSPYKNMDELFLIPAQLVTPRSKMPTVAVVASLLHSWKTAYFGIDLFTPKATLIHFCSLKEKDQHRVQYPASTSQLQVE